VHRKFSGELINTDISYFILQDFKNFVKLMRIQFMLTVIVLDIDTSWINVFKFFIENL